MPTPRRGPAAEAGALSRRRGRRRAIGWFVSRESFLSHRLYRRIMLALARFIGPLKLRRRWFDDALEVHPSMSSDINNRAESASADEGERRAENANGNAGAGGPDRRQSVVDRRTGVDRRQRTAVESGYVGPERRVNED